MNKRVTCLIPFFNEREKISENYDELRKVKLISDFVFVDDGSNDGTSDVLAGHPKPPKIIRLTGNSGKSNAVFAGLSKIKSQYVMLFDADVRFVDSNEIENGLGKVLEDPSISMLIFRRTNSPFAAKIVRSDILLSGERVMKREILEGTYREFNPEGYELETAINQYCINHNLKSVWADTSTVNTFKASKVGFIRGIMGDLNTFFNVATFVGVVNHLRQIISFCKLRV